MTTHEEYGYNLSHMEIAAETCMDIREQSVTSKRRIQQKLLSNNKGSYHICINQLVKFSNLHLWGIQEIVIQRAKAAASRAADRSPSTLIHFITRTTTKKVKTRETETILTAQQVIHKEDFSEKVVAYQKQHGQSKHLKP